MGLKKRSKVSAEFSMSSLTDIIFLLLIFFMLTSSLVKFDQFTLPESNAKTMAPTSIVVTMEENGKYTVNGKPTPKRALQGAISRTKRSMTNEESSTLTIVAEVGVPFDKVVEMMTIANGLKMKAILATRPVDEK
ncbi:MAG: biopolymer transporter ExbD [Bacteroidota bacterium]